MIELEGRSAATVPAVPRLGRASSRADRLRRRIGLAAIAGQLAILVAALLLFHVEERQGLLVLTPFVLAGFLIHAVLPLAKRPAFFLALSLAGLFAVLGAATGAVVVLLGLALFATCHLPVRRGVRIGLLAALTGLLVAARAGFASLPPAVGLALPVVGSLFMFRLIVYLYDLRHERPAPGSWTTRLSYFFLLPNFCFLVFPVVDWAAFRRTWYDAEDLAIYQRGLARILRGTLHLVTYRAIAHYLTPVLGEVDDLLGVAHFLVASYAQLLRISGQFHIAVGILSLFGWNLPRTQIHYFLASGFADYWRRANVYWRDFMVKIFLYPIFQRLRRLGLREPLVLATLLVFVATWLLHSWQWFWLIGSVRLGGVDALFWGIFGAAVAINVALERRRSRRRRDPTTPAACLADAIRILATFTATCLLWSLWTSESVAAWWDLLARGRHGGWDQLALLVAVALALLSILALVIRHLRSRPVGRNTQLEEWSWPRAAPVAAAAAVLALLGFSPLQTRLPEPVGRIAFALTEEGVSAVDADAARAGYYDELQGTARLSEQHWFYRAKAWRDRRADPLTTHDGYVRRKLRPSVDTIYQGSRFRTNRWGMRDDDHPLEKAPGTFRIAVVGPSDALGWGVDDEAVFERVLEARLAGIPTPLRLELLNFSIPDLGPLEQVMVLRDDVLRFRPDALLFVLHQADERRALEDLAHWRQRRLELPAGLTPFAADLDATGDGGADAIPRPAAPGVLGWALATSADLARRHGVHPVALILPNLQVPADRPARARIRAAAEAAGYEVLDLATLFDGVPHRKLTVTPWDQHPGATAHRRIATALLERLPRSELGRRAGLAGHRPERRTDDGSRP